MSTHGIDPVWFVKLEGSESEWFRAWGENYNSSLIKGVLRLRKERRLKRLRRNKRRKLLNKLLVCTGLFIDTETNQ